jgi:hypothetical protein
MGKETELKDPYAIFRINIVITFQLEKHEFIVSLKISRKGFQNVHQLFLVAPILSVSLEIHFDQVYPHENSVSMIDYIFVGISFTSRAEVKVTKKAMRVTHDILLISLLEE